MRKANTHQPADTLQAVRCAVYTRKSTEEVLEQEFNTLDAQRESAEAYIFSQQQEGWTCLPERYDDGGFTGGNMDRPALKRLLADIEAGRVDAVVVYKVDRLSRSLLDFARMLEVFDTHHVAFVSVTQQINSATSMGRLMLNVLLSFAQFEREIIGERTRDKIAATRRKGKWSGGRPLLGYDVDPRSTRLVVNEDEAARVRAIFALYLEQESLLPVVQELERRGWTNKRWKARSGKECGGGLLDKTSLHRMLVNPLYSGRVKYKRERHAGEHAAIVEPATFDRVQALLKRNRRTRPASGDGEDRMNTPLTIACAVHFHSQAKGRKELHPGHATTPVAPDRVPRVAKLLALAHRFEQLLHDCGAGLRGVIEDCAINAPSGARRVIQA
jgi:site-specific DNA recombinase